MATTSLLVGLELQISLFLVALLWSFHVRLGKQDFFRWWTWAWAAFACYLGVGLIALYSGPRWNLLKGSLVLTATVCGLLHPFFLAVGTWPARTSGGTRVRVQIGTALTLAASALAFVFSLHWKADPQTSFAVRSLPRSTFLFLSLLLCASIFFRRWRRSRSSASITIATFCVLYASSQCVYALVDLRQIIRSSVVLFAPSFMTLLSPNSFYFDVIGQFGICLGMTLFVFEEHQQMSRALQTAEFQRRQEASANAALQAEIRERTKAEAALRTSEDRYRDLVQHSEDLLCTHDLEGRLLSVNPAPARVLGYTSDELLQIPMRELIVPEYRNEFDAYLDRIKTAGVDDGLLMVQTRRGEARIWEYHNTLRSDGVPKPLVRGMAHDVTERKRVEKALQRREESYRMFVDQSSEGIFCQNLDAPLSVDLPEEELIHRILHESYMAECNDALAKMYGLTSSKNFIGRRLVETLDPNDPHNVELTRDFIRSGFRIVDRESHEADIHGNAKVFLNSMTGIVKNGKMLYTWGIQRDITERVRLERAREKAEEALRKSEEHFRVALTSSPITVFDHDRELRYTWIYNPGIFEGKDVLGRTDCEILGQEGAASLEEAKRQVIETGVGTRTDITVSEDGKRFHLDVTLEPRKNESGQVVGLTGAAMDVARLREFCDLLQEQRDKLFQEKLYLESEIQSELGFEQIIGRSQALRAILKKARVVAPTNATVLLQGETGTGKELIARSIHQLSSRKDKSFIKLNCAAVPFALLESELFGHEKGAFTDAINQKIGRLELADGGTLFLDEIGEMPIELQPKLLRVLQDQEFERLGSVRTVRVDARIIAATNRNLPQRVAEKGFRQDLFYRLNVFPITLPPLRERRSDIPLLITHFIRKHGSRLNHEINGVTSETLHALSIWDWPGNVRELENVIERLVILTKGPVLQLPSDSGILPGRGHG